MVYFSTGTVADLVTVPLLEPPSDSGSFRPEPDDCKGSSSNVAAGLSAVEPSNVISGSKRRINENLSPSSMSNSPDVINAVIAEPVLPSLLSSPSSCVTKLLL